MWKMILFLFLILILLQAILGSTLPMPARRSHEISRATLSHSRLSQPSHKRHHLSAEDNLVQVSALNVSSHMGFDLHLIVDGLEYWLGMDTGSSDIFIKGENTSGSPKHKYKSQ